MTKRRRRTITITIIETWTLRWADPDKASERGFVEDCLTDNEVAKEPSDELSLRHAQIIQFTSHSSSDTTIPTYCEDEHK